MKKIVIVGGGTSGWMTANIFAHSLKSHNFDITLIESPDIATIGVGEGSTPALKVFFDRLGISENEWMPQCNATYKCGITFSDWSTKPGFESYFHPFASSIDAQTEKAFKDNCQTYLTGYEVEVNPNRFFLASHLAQHSLAPIPNYNFPFDVSYGYHFDALLLGKFLRKKAVERGVKHVVSTVEHVGQGKNGHVDFVFTGEHKKYFADLFVDCSGFSSLLSQTTLKTRFLSYQNSLFNDAAVALPSPITDEIPSQTISTALRFGWAWKIPLRNRFGNGYVYSSAYCSADEAELELRRHLNLVDSEVEARHLKMRVGRVTESWNKNVLAVGLSQGFIEPLEATALLLIQQTASLFAHLFIEGQYTDKFRKQFNDTINQQFDRTKDYIYTHYQTNSRYDSDYWKDNRENKSVMGDSLAKIYECWVRGNDLEKEILHQNIQNYYPVSSWYCILAGSGMLPNSHLLKKALPKQDAFKSREVEQFIYRCAINFRDHREVLESGCDAKSLALEQMFKRPPPHSVQQSSMG